MPSLDPGLRAVARAAERLQIFEVERLFRRVTHGPNVIHFQPVTRAAFDALETVAPLRHQAQRRPAPIAINPCAVSFEGYAHITLPALGAGRLSIRAPSETASIAAQAASIRPKLRPLAGFELPAGSVSTTVSAKAWRNR